MKSCVIAVMISLLMAAPIEGQTPQYMPKTGGTFTGPVNTVQVNGSYTPAAGAALQTILTAAGATSDIFLPCGTFNAAGLTIAFANVHFHGVSYLCTVVNFTTTAGLLVNGTGVEIDGIHFQGATSAYTVKASATAASSFKFHDNEVTGAGSGGVVFPQAALWIEAPFAHAWVERNLFTANGTTGTPGGSTVITDGSGAGYVSDLHFNGNLIYGNTDTLNFAGFDCQDCEAGDNYIDQNNQILGAGSGYGVLNYGQGYASLGLTSIARVSNVVTAVQAGAATWTYAVGQQVQVSASQFGTNGSNFNGVFTLTAATLTGPGWTLQWSQTAPDDSVVATTAALVATVSGLKLHGNTIKNAGGACVYGQSINDFELAHNVLINCDVQQVPGSLLYGGLSLNGAVNGAVNANVVDGVIKGSAIALGNVMGLAVTGNTAQNAFKQGIQMAGVVNSTISTNTVKNNSAGGISGPSTTTMNAFNTTLSGNDVWPAPATDGIDLLGLDSSVSISGGSVHGPPSGAGGAAGVRLGANVSNVQIATVRIDCRADQSTLVTNTYGIRSAGTANKIELNDITGCSLNSSSAGIFDTGTDDLVKHNKVTTSWFGVLSNAGTRQQIIENELWGNTTAISTAGATTPFLSGNQLAQASGIDSYNSTNGYQVGGVTVLPAALVGFQGATGTKVGLTLGAMTSGNLRSTDANGNEVDAALAANAPTKTYTCGTTTSCSGSQLVSPHITTGQVTLSAGAATITGIPAYTSTSTFSCTCTDASSAAACKSVNASTTSISLTGTGTDSVGYMCAGN